MQLRVKKDFLVYSNQEEKFFYGLLMWFFLFLGYFAFAFNWIVLGKLEGSSGGGSSGGSSGAGGWAQALQANTETVKEAVNYSIPFARGLATIPVAWFMKKLTHRYAVLLALFLNTAAFPLIFAPYFWLFVIGRIFMAFGGTMLVIFVQPILTCFFNKKYKSILSVLNLTAYVLAGLICNIFFAIPGFEKMALTNWKTVGGIAGAITYLPLIFYLLFGKNFNPEVKNHSTLKSDDPEKPATYGEIIREKNMWFWIFFYSFCLVVSVVVANFVPKIIEKISKQVVESFSSWKSVYSIIFYFGYLSGFSIGVWNKTRARRKPFVFAAMSIGAFCWTSIILIALLLQSNTTLSTVLIFILAYIFAFFSLGIQSVVFYIPHEYPGNSPKRITIFFSYMWGFGYLLLGVYSVIASSLLDIPSAGTYISAGLITILIVMTSVFSFLIKETKPHWPIIPLNLAKKLRIPEKKLYGSLYKKIHPCSFNSFSFLSLNN